MKRIFIFLIVLVVVFATKTSALDCTTEYAVAPIEAINIDDEWEYIGGVECYKYSEYTNGIYHDIDARLYVRAIGNRLFYRIKNPRDENIYNVSVNPNYNPKSPKKCDHFLYIAGYWYIKSI